jgi:hypothetical protein
MTLAQPKRKRSFVAKDGFDIIDDGCFTRRSFDCLGIGLGRWRWLQKISGRIYVLATSGDSQMDNP